nr:MAG TPA_asm: Head fiber protein [Caudoviricetes sp.]
MYLKREREFQYHPGIEKIIEGVIGGGTIARTDFAGAIFKGVPLDELPPLVIVVQDETTGIYHALKTAKVTTAAVAAAVEYQVKKNHVFAVGDVVTVGGSFAGAADTITKIDKSNADYDVITVEGSIGAAAVDAVLVLAKAKATAGAVVPKYGTKTSELYITMSKVNLTVANQSAGLLVRGTVNGKVLPFPIDDALETRLQTQGIRIV